MFSKPETKSAFKGVFPFNTPSDRIKPNLFNSDLLTAWTDNQAKCAGQTLRAGYGIHKIIWRDGQDQWTN